MLHRIFLNNNNNNNNFDHGTPIMKLSNWLVSMYGVVACIYEWLCGFLWSFKAFVDCGLISIDSLFLPLLPSLSFLFYFIHCFLILIFDHGMASPCMDSDAVNCCMRCFINCFVINSLTPLCFLFRILFVCLYYSSFSNILSVSDWSAVLIPKNHVSDC